MLKRIDYNKFTAAFTSVMPQQWYSIITFDWPISFRQIWKLAKKLLWKEERFSMCSNHLLHVYFAKPFQSHFSISLSCFPRGALRGNNVIYYSWRIGKEKHFFWYILCKKLLDIEHLICRKLLPGYKTRKFPIYVKTFEIQVGLIRRSMPVKTSY